VTLKFQVRRGPASYAAYAWVVRDFVGCNKLPVKMESIMKAIATLILLLSSFSFAAANPFGEKSLEMEYLIDSASVDNTGNCTPLDANAVYRNKREYIAAANGNCEAPNVAIRCGGKVWCVAKGAKCCGGDNLCTLGNCVRCAGKLNCAPKGSTCCKDKLLCPPGKQCKSTPYGAKCSD